MTGFSAQWLALREPADHRARNLALQTQVVAFLNALSQQKAESIRITDLGSGTGSNLRALAPLLTERQCWTLVDHDPNLLLAANAALALWADEVLAPPQEKGVNPNNPVIPPLLILKNQKRIAVHFRCLDLTTHFETAMDFPADLITAAAFFDLVAADWLSAFCMALSKPLYTVLTYDGFERWGQPEISDGAILKAFHAHQRRNKGFGSALGPDAANCMVRLLEERGFKVSSAASPWILGDQDRSLIQALATGTANAVRETDSVDESVLKQWEASRSQPTQCEISHLDVFAIDSASQQCIQTK